jgi:histidine triad (HIT) family protein
MDCLFCKIAKGTIPAGTVYEDAHARAFLDIHPCVPGHTVVIPKVHAKDLIALPKAEIAPFFGAVQTVAEAVQKALRADGLTIGMNQGEAAGQAIPHLHVHILPRKQGDGGGSVHTVVRVASTEPLDEMASRIANCIPQ